MISLLVKKFNLYFNTIKYLKFKQVYWRLRYKYPRKKKALVTNSDIKSWLSPWASPRWNLVKWDLNSTFTFLSVTKQVSESCWQDKVCDKLWLYNLHYLDCLNNEGNNNLSAELNLVNTWIKCNQDESTVGWEPYCLSLRLVNMIKWMSRNSISDEHLVRSVEKQAFCLLGKIEYHVLANHLFANTKSLIFAGAFLKGKLADKCLNVGLDLLDKELIEQFLSDGGHYEKSPMYHQILTHDLLDLLNLLRISGVARLKAKESMLISYIERAEFWRLSMLHPSGELAFFNDCAEKIAPPNFVIDEYLKRLNIRVAFSSVDKLTVLKETGFYVCNIPEDGKLIFDVGTIGPDYQPGHAHADSLSIEFSLFGSKLFVNSGTSVYGNSELRTLQRSTLLHNTVSVNKQSSSQIWGGFRVAKRANILNSEAQETCNGIYLLAEHDGFIQQKLASKHVRKIHVDKGKLIIEDIIERFTNSFVSRLFLHPNVDVKCYSEHDVTLFLNGEKVQVTLLNGTLNIVDSIWYPAFGESYPNKCIEIDATDTWFVKLEVSWEHNCE